jgi:integrase
MKHNRKRYQHGSLTIEKRKTGPDVYVYRFREGTSKRKIILGSVKELTKTKAQRKAQEYRQQANDPTAKTDSLLTVAQLVNHYIECELGESASKSAKVKKAYRYIFTNYIVQKWGSLPLAMVKAVAVEDWLKSLKKANGTKAKIREVFGAAFRHGVRHELFATNPIANVRQVRKRATEPSILEPEETLSIIRELEDVEPVRTAFIVAAFTGMRRGEVFGLKWADVDLDSAVVRIRRSYVDGVEGPPKTDSSRKPLRVAPDVVDALKQWKEKSSFTKPDDWVFASELSFGKQPLWPGTLWRRNVAPAIQGAEIHKPSRLGWHSLRRGFASYLFAGGSSARTSMEAMRHSTADMTLGTYAQTLGNEVGDAVCRVADLIMGRNKAA